MISSELTQRFAAPQVGAAVADPRDFGVTIFDASGDDGRTHVRMSCVVSGGLGDFVVRTPHRGSQRQLQRGALQHQRNHDKRQRRRVAVRRPAAGARTDRSVNAR